MTLDAGLRTLRTFPRMIGIVLASGSLHQVQAAYHMEREKPVLDIEGELITRLLRSRPHANVGFWRKGSE